MPNKIHANAICIGQELADYSPCTTSDPMPVLSPKLGTGFTFLNTKCKRDDLPAAKCGHLISPCPQSLNYSPPDSFQKTSANPGHRSNIIEGQEFHMTWPDTVYLEHDFSPSLALPLGCQLDRGSECPGGGPGLFTSHLPQLLAHGRHSEAPGKARDQTHQSLPKW